MLFEDIALERARTLPTRVCDRSGVNAGSTDSRSAAKMIGKEHMREVAVAMRARVAGLSSVGW